MIVPENQEALTLHTESLVVDVCGTTNFMWPTPIVNGRTALDRALDGGIDCAVLTISAFDESFMDCVKLIASMTQFAREHSDRVCIAETAADIRQAKSDGKLAMVLALQTGSPVEHDWLTTLSALAKLGVRQMQLTYNERNRLGSGCLEPNDDGLSAYGRQVLDGMNHFGVIPDIAHAGARTSKDVLKFSRGPVICSHGNAAAVTAHPRNLTDDMMKAVAATGGVIGVAAWTPLNMKASGTVPTLSDYVDHIEYILDVVGSDSVAIGLDVNENMQALPGRSVFEYIYDAQQPDWAGMPQSVSGLDNLSYVPDITRELLVRGHSSAFVKKILGENYLRVATSVWSR